MYSTIVLFSIIFLYLLVLFLVAHFAEKKEREGSSLVSNPYVYSLSLAVYCTSWTFYGSVGKAANSGLIFLTIYIGPTLMAALWWVVLRKIVLLSKENRITTISDFIAARYGNSLSLSALVSVVALVGITPYIGLQLKAVMTTFSIMAGQPEGSRFAGLFITGMLGMFAIIFGARRLDASERHGGLVFAV
ncbi:MAG: sodium:solute symporter family transporter, partial [Thermodesulfovibrionales bacterium]